MGRLWSRGSRQSFLLCNRRPACLLATRPTDRPITTPSTPHPERATHCCEASLAAGDLQQSADIGRALLSLTSSLAFGCGESAAPYAAVATRCKQALKSAYDRGAPLRQEVRCGGVQAGDGRLGACRLHVQPPGTAATFVHWALLRLPWLLACLFFGPVGPALLTCHPSSSSVPTIGRCRVGGRLRPLLSLALADPLVRPPLLRRCRRLHRRGLVHRRGGLPRDCCWSWRGVYGVRGRW